MFLRCIIQYMKKTIFYAIFLVMLAAFLFFWRTGFFESERKDAVQTGSVPEIDSQILRESEVMGSTDNNEVKTDTDKIATPVQIKKTKAPFTSQAPLGDWSDQRFQDGCEEASIAMAIKWVQGKAFVSPSEAQQEIINISKFEEKTFGHYIDASVEDVGKIFSQFYGFENFVIKRDIVSADLISELEKGNIILIPAYGRALKNPNYTAPGPIAHMLVIVGYDPKTGEFITNDPGTKKGEGYRYDEKVLFEAIWAYPSGKDHPSVPKSTEQKAMLVVMQK